jgi:hypothetical protein
MSDDEQDIRNDREMKDNRYKAQQELAKRTGNKKRRLAR